MTFFINYYHIDKSKEIKISFRQGRQYNYNKGGRKKNRLFREHDTYQKKSIFCPLSGLEEEGGVRD